MREDKSAINAVAIGDSWPDPELEREPSAAPMTSSSKPMGDLLRDSTLTTTIADQPRQELLLFLIAGTRLTVVESWSDRLCVPTGHIACHRALVDFAAART